MGDTDTESSERRPGLSELLDRARRAGEIHTMLPAMVTRYDPAKRQVDVKVLVQRAYLDEAGARQTKSVAVVCNVPISWPGGGGYVLTFPISDGVASVVDGATGTPPATVGMLIVAERSLDKWLSGAGGEVDPEIDHDHDLTDGVFVPELRPFGASYPATPSDHAVLGADGGVQIHLRGSSICVGDEAGSSFIARADKVLTELGKIATAFGTVLTHTHAVVGSSATQSPNIGAGYSSSAVAATQGKTQ